MKVFKFHQFVRVERGPVNSLLADLLKGDIFQVSNEEIDKFEKREYDDIKDFIEQLKSEQLVIETEKNRWIPELKLEIDKDKENLDGKPIRIITLEIEEGVDIHAFYDFLSPISTKINKIFFYGKNNTSEVSKFFPGVPIILKDKKFESCMLLAGVTEDFLKVKEDDYRFKMHFNSCWGGRIAVTSDGKLRPCIYSTIVLGDIKEKCREKIIDEYYKYWRITKDKVAICKDCELKYVCFDCREISLRETGDLYGNNPYCKYDPYKGKWSK
jgi:radical SAM protein with 4Fe4S-binding SPASM domain